jgi:Pin2-interacting protein X1
MATADVMVDLAGSKLRKKHGSSLQEHLSAPTSAFARKQLEKMGWTEGTGLGKKRDGITTHVKVKKREDKAGLGIEKVATEKRAAGEQWWKDSLGDTLARLGSKQKKKKSSKRKREYTDEELFEATGGARFGMRAAPTQKLAKWRRSESGASSSVGESVREGDMIKEESSAQSSSDQEKRERKKKKFSEEESSSQSSSDQEKRERKKKKQLSEEERSAQSSSDQEKIEKKKKKKSKKEKKSKEGN